MPDDVYVPVHGTPESEKLRIVDNRATFAQDAPRRRSSRGVTLGPASLESSSPAKPVPAMAKPAPKVKPKPEDLEKAYENLKKQVYSEGEARLALGPSVGPNRPRYMPGPENPRQLGYGEHIRSQIQSLHSQLQERDAADKMEVQQTHQAAQSQLPPPRPQTSVAQMAVNNISGQKPFQWQPPAWSQKVVRGINKAASYTPIGWAANKLGRWVPEAQKRAQEEHMKQQLQDEELRSLDEKNRELQRILEESKARNGG